MIQSEKLKEHAKRLRLYNIANRMDSILHHAQEEKPTYPEFLSLVLGTEVEMKERKDYERRLVAARLPRKVSDNPPYCGVAHIPCLDRLELE